MKKNKIFLRGNLYILQQFLAVISIISIVILIFNSFMNFEYISGNKLHSEIFFLNPFEAGGDFKDSEVFNKLLHQSIEDITSYTVIKSQMEDNGVFNGKKEIDIVEFSHRKENYSGNAYYPISVKYYLNDLIKWGRYDERYKDNTKEIFFDSIWSAVCYFEPDVIEEYFYVLEFYKDKDFHLLYDGESYYYIDHYGNYISVYHDAAQGLEIDLPEIEGDENIFRSSNLNSAKQPSVLDTIISTAYYYEISRNAMDHASVLESAEIQPSVFIKLLKERYAPVDEKKIIDRAKTWSEYFSLCDYVQKSIENFSNNYIQYISYRDEYRNGNLKFCVSILEDGKENFYSNDEKSLNTKIEHLNQYYSKEFERYIIYSPSEMIYYTNTNMKENIIYEQLNRYPYAFPEHTKVWIGLGNKQLYVDDQFTEAAAIFEGFLPKAWIYISLSTISLIGWIILFLYLCGITGKRVDTEGKEYTYAYWFDKIPTELEILVFIGLGFLYVLGFRINARMVEQNFIHLVEIKSKWVYFNSGILSLILSILICAFMYSFIRRVRVKNLWSRSFIRLVCILLYRGIKFLVMKSKNAILFVYDHGKFMTRVVLPSFIVFFLNIIWGMVFYRFLYAGLDYRTYFVSFSIRAFFILLIMVLIICVDFGVILIALWAHKQRIHILDGIHEICKGDLSYKIETETMHGENQIFAEAVNQIGDSIRGAVEISMKDERLKADLITNVSHDIKTPLTSIINYVDLLKRENIDTEPTRTYISVLDAKTQRLKQLTEDLVEASKISSGNITLIMNRINLVELLNQAAGEFEEKLLEKEISIVKGYGNQAVCIMADNRRIWRVVENLLNNIYKYAMGGTRTYIDMEIKDEDVLVSFKNISAQELNIQADELTERFIRGDVSRSTEGSGLGLSIAKSLTEAQGGKFNIYLDGDLFKVTLEFPMEE